MRLLLLCPGRGSYGRAQLGSLPADSPTLDWLDDYRAGLDRPTLRELDGANRFSPRLHLAGEHASLLTFGATLADLERLDPDTARIVAVAGNSMGWYTALAVAGALPLEDAAALVETMGAYQADKVIGAQLLYPVTGEDWQPDPTLQAAVDAALDIEGAHLSIRLGGTAVIGVSADALPRVREALPALERGAYSFPLQLPLHSAFHTPLMQRTSEQARIELSGLSWRTPSRSLVDGRGQLLRPWASPRAIADYTLGAQVIEPFDLSLCLATALGEFGPDAVLLPGPGNSLGSAVAQAMIAIGWRGLRDRQDFMEAQGGEHPAVISMALPEQRARVVG